ncbi:heavy-metal-associated domain-containing protein [Nonlabens xiamenensis]|uniref:heavy-metal-associated domain-containing protein n=1 Tax=Nonlabens xiamenensis TaxID=2341043 RepID=UPI000F614294|nr:cation transporter [Nonlabens xiamenensis]
MKNIIILITIAIGLTAFAKADAQNNNLDHFEIQVDGLGCPFCAYGLEKKFKEFKGIKNVEIQIESGDFSFDYPSEKNLKMEAVLTQVEKAGYTPNEATITRADGSVETNAVDKAMVNKDNLAHSTLFVNGKCGMCKARIEKAVSDLPGVQQVSWDVDSKMLKVTHDADVTSEKQVAAATANVGHDTKTVRADESVYDALPACCHYKRTK